MTQYAFSLFFVFSDSRFGAVKVTPFFVADDVTISRTSRNLGPGIFFSLSSLWSALMRFYDCPFIYFLVEELSLQDRGSFSPFVLSLVE